MAQGVVHDESRQERGVLVGQGISQTDGPATHGELEPATRLSEFIDGASRLKGHAKAIDIWRMETKAEAEGPFLGRFRGIPRRTAKERTVLWVVEVRLRVVSRMKCTFCVLGLVVINLFWEIRACLDISYCISNMFPASLPKRAPNTGSRAALRMHAQGLTLGNLCRSVSVKQQQQASSCQTLPRRLPCFRIAFRLDLRMT